MKIQVLLVGALVSACTWQSLANNSEDFDVPNGLFSTLSSGALAPKTLISCKFTVAEVYFGSKWIPSVSIIFEGAINPDEHSVNIKLSATQSKRNKEWRHQFLLTDSVGRESVISAYTGLSDSVLPMHLLLDDDNYIVFFVGEPENMSMLDVSQYALVTWKVVASGVKGSGDCNSRLLRSDDSM